MKCDPDRRSGVRRAWRTGDQQEAVGRHAQLQRELAVHDEVTNTAVFAASGHAGAMTGVIADPGYGMLLD